MTIRTTNRARSAFSARDALTLPTRARVKPVGSVRAVTLAAMTASAALVASVGACSGPSDSELFARTGISSTPSDPTTSGSASATPPATTPPAATPSATATGEPGTPPSASPAAPPTPPVPPPWKSPGIACSKNEAGVAQYCEAPAEVCCLTLENHTNVKAACKTDQACDGLDVQCDDETDCPNGQLCCGILARDGSRGVLCKPSCTTNQPDRLAFRMCDPLAPIDPCKAIGKTCKRGDGFSGYYVCE